MNKSKSVSEQLLEKGHLRFISFKDSNPVNLILTLTEAKNGQQCWHFSISHGTENGPQRVDDELAGIISHAFLEDGYAEVEAKAVWKTIRHYEKFLKPR